MLNIPKDANLAYLIGALADGSLYHNKKHYVYRITYYQSSKEYLRNCIEPLICKLFHKKGHFYFDKRKKVYFYEITSKNIYLIYQKVIESFKSDKHRKIPSWITGGNEMIQTGFIRGFFDADGFYYFNPKKCDYRVRFGQAEYYILKELRMMLNFKFKCSKVLGPYQTKEGVKPYYKMHIYGIEQVYKFYNYIKPCHPNKKLNSILKNDESIE